MIGTKILEERKSKFNGELRVIKSFGLGTYIQAGGLTQSGGIVEGIWKSTLKKINKEELIVKNCLVLGLGGGTAAKLINKNWSDAKITGVDIDFEMIELGKKYLGLDSTGMKIIVGDAYKFNSKKTFDLILVDLYNGDQFPQKFEETVFLEKVKKMLSKNGIAIFNRLYYGDKRPMAVKFGLKLKKNFGKVEYFYPEANLMLIAKS